MANHAAPHRSRTRECGANRVGYVTMIARVPCGELASGSGVVMPPLSVRAPRRVASHHANVPVADWLAVDADICEAGTITVDGGRWRRFGGFRR
jgi:hypothetical protein